MQTKTEMLNVSITADTARRLRAFAKARNGQIDNQADATIRHGIEALYREAPYAFKVRFEAALSDKEGQAGD
tara:strand:- start:909 stop:1124 length:216 start_codon:yes stop_codon:yes gene_type:complete